MRDLMVSVNNNVDVALVDEQQASSIQQALQGVLSILRDSEQGWMLFGKALESLGVKTSWYHFSKILNMTLNDVAFVVRDKNLDVSMGKTSILKRTQDNIIVNLKNCVGFSNPNEDRKLQLIFILSLLDICFESVVTNLRCEDQLQLKGSPFSTYKSVLQQTYDYSFGSSWRSSLLGGDLIIVPDDGNGSFHLKLLTWSEYYETIITPLSDKDIQDILQKLTIPVK